MDQDVMQTLPDGTKFSLPRRADAANARKIIDFRSTRGNEIYLWTMPRTGGGLCYLFNRGEGCPPSESGAGFPTLNGGLSGGADPILLFLQTKPDVAAVELRYQNGDSERVMPVDGFVLTEITRAHYAQGAGSHQPLHSTGAEARWTPNASTRRAWASTRAAPRRSSATA